MDRDKIVCNCVGVTVGDIHDAIKNGASSFDEVQEATGVSSVCGGCREYAEKLVNDFLKE